MTKPLTIEEIRDFMRTAGPGYYGNEADEHIAFLLAEVERLQVANTRLVMRAPDEYPMTLAGKKFRKMRESLKLAEDFGWENSFADYNKPPSIDDLRWALQWAEHWSEKFGDMLKDLGEKEEELAAANKRIAELEKNEGRYICACNGLCRDGCVVRGSDEGH